MFIPLAIHAIHGSCMLYTWCLYIWENPKTFQVPPRIGWRTVKPAQGAGVVAPALEWTPPGQGSVPTAKTWSKPTNSGEGNAKALGILPLRMCKNMLLIIATRILCLTPIDPALPPHFCASGRHRLGHLSLNRHPAIGNDVAPHYCQQLQKSRSAAGEAPFLS